MKSGRASPQRTTNTNTSDMELSGFCKQDRLTLYSSEFCTAQVNFISLNMSDPAITLVPPPAPADSSKDHSHILVSDYISTDDWS
jgi:hypothetical protein